MFVRIKTTQSNHNTNTGFLINLLQARGLLEEKVRINLYLPRVVVKVMDSMTSNRSALVENLVVDKAKSIQKLPYGTLKSKTSPKQIDEITTGWDKTVNEL